MKFFVGLFLIVIYAVAAVSAAPVSELDKLQPINAKQDGEEPVDTLESLRIRKAARSYGGAQAYVPSVPCPKSYLFSCQPQLAPVQCSPEHPGYGGHGAYTEPIAQWAAAHPKDN